VQSVLYDASRLLESLYEVSGVESFLLAVDPSNPADEGFLGGSLAGREFWRGTRGGGETGAKAFKSFCLRQIDAQPTQEASSFMSSISRKTGPSKSLKTNLYDCVRKALRAASGIRNAEMKWTSPERLDVYGVRLVGWPPDIPSQNPSTLKVGQNKRLLECIQNGTLRFEKTFPTDSEMSMNTVEQSGSTENLESEDFSWAYDADAGGFQSNDTLPPLHRATHFHTHIQNLDSPPGSGLSSYDAWVPSCSVSRSDSLEPPSRKRPRQSSSDIE